MIGRSVLIPPESSEQEPRRGEDTTPPNGTATLRYLIPTTIESGPARCSTRISRNPASFIQPRQSAPVKSNPPGVSMSMFKLMSNPKACSRRASSINAS